ncbi:MAG: immunoglobulin domain-containing protein, partial [Tepidisphaeraceae bacterium]
MKKNVIAALGLISCLLSAQGQYFTNGNLAVLSVGGPGQYLNSSGAATNGSAVTILQFTTSGQQVSSLTLPTNGATAFNLYGSFTEGFMSLSPNGQYLVIPGYNGPVPLGVNPEASFSTNVPRAVATVDGYGNYSLPIANTNVFNAATIRGAAFDGTNFWVSGSGSTSNSTVPGILYTNSFGVVYVGTAGSTGGNVRVGVTGSGNERCLNIYNNTLYVSTGSTARGVWAVPGAGFPPISGANTNTVQTIAMNSSSSPYDFVFDSSNTTCYVADSTFGILKFTNNAGTWVSNYTLSTATAGAPTVGAQGVTADFTQNPPVIYATTGETLSNRLVSIVDSGPTATATFLAQGIAGPGGTNFFKGVRFVPISLPVITSQPSGVVQSADGVATFTVSATGTPTLSYQWYTNSVAVIGATSSSFTLNTLTTSQNGTVVYVVVSSPYGTVTSSNATLTVNANYFIPGNLAVVSVGGPGQTISSTGDTVSILQYTTAAGQSSPVSTLPLPTSGPNAFALDNSSTEGFLTLTANGQYLVLGGYNTTVPVAGGVVASTSASVPRAVAIVDGYGNYSLPIANTNVLTQGNIRGAVFDGTNNFWVTGYTTATLSSTNYNGIIYVGTPGSTGV